MDPVKKNQQYDTVAAHSVSAEQEMVPNVNRIGKELDIFASNGLLKWERFGEFCMYHSFLTRR